MNKFDTILFTIFIFLISVFGKSLDVIESIIFYSIPIIFSFSVLKNKQKLNLSKTAIFYQLIFIIFLLINVIFSRNIGISYYQFFAIICSILIVNLAITYTDQDIFLKYLVTFSFIYSSIFLLDKFGLIHLAPKAVGDNFIKQFWGHSYISDILVISIPLLIYQRVHPLLILFQIITLVLTNSRSSLFILPFIIFLIPKISKFQKIIFSSLVMVSLIVFTLLIRYDQITQKDITGSRIDYWQQAIQGFLHRPEIGNGLNTFDIVSYQYRQNQNQSSSAHNSILSLLCELGLFISVFIFFIIKKQLVYQYQNNYLLFILAISLIANSLFDSTINSFGMAIILGYLLFKNKPLPPANFKIQKKYILLITILCLLHFISKTSSDYLFFIKHQPQLAKITDPFNLNAYIQLKETTPLYHDEEKIYQGLIFRQQFSINNLNIYQKLIDLNPKDNCQLIYNISHYYYTRQDFTQLDKYLSIFENQVYYPQANRNCVVNLSRIYYLRAQIYYSQQNYEASLDYLQKASRLIPDFSHPYIEIANLYHYQNQNQEAIEELRFCTQNQFAAPHCQSYLDQQPHIKFEIPFSKGMINIFENEKIL